MPVVYGGETLTGELHMHFELGDPRPDPKRGLDREVLQLTLTVAGQSFTSGKTESGWFEDELVGIQAALPAGMYMKCCFTCAFSDYHPVGNSLFGDLACFRDNKEAYRQVWSKYQLFEIWDTRTDFVQETLLCPEFERREPGAGYRG
jgi:hypothetical protein